ncbi:MAG TPA: CoA transferase [Burkholderiaceae bacterium]|nr:CoA transferase [Burkholderiaceae bacterium]
MDGAATHEGVLSGIRVLDFGRFIAGPFCGALLADHGADVIRVDKVGGSEDRCILPLAASGEGGLYMQVNRGKRSLSLDPTAAEGREIVRRLIARSDVVIANMPAATLQSMELDYARVSAINPRAILVATNAFGHSGPYAHRLGFDGLGQALSGTAYMTGDPGAPRRAAVNWVDFGTAISAAFGTLLALMARERSGRGQEVSGSLMATALTFANSVLIEQAINKPDRRPQGNLGYGSAPADLFECGDGQWLIVQAVGQPLWERFCAVLGATDWLADPRFADDSGRGRHAHVVSERLGAWCAARSRDEAIRAFEAARIPAGPVHSPQQALDDAHVRASGMLREIAFPGAPRPAPVAETPVRLSATPGAIRGRAPLLGEHTEAILAEIGYPPEHVARLRDAGVV